MLNNQVKHGPVSTCENSVHQEVACNESWRHAHTETVYRQVTSCLQWEMNGQPHIVSFHECSKKVFVFCPFQGL